MAFKLIGKNHQVSKKVLEQGAKVSFLFLKKDLEVNLRFVSGKEITKLNNKYRGQNSPTDVLSFEDGDGTGGDIVICYQILIREARDWDLSIDETAVFLLVHGILHLASYDHQRSQDRAKMEKAEEEILKKLQISIKR